MDSPAPPLDGDLLLAHEPFVHAIARGLLHDEHAARDVAQDSFLKALQRGPRALTSLRAWLARTARNRALELRRSDVRRMRREARVVVSGVVESADATCERLELQRDVIAAVLELDEPYRSIVILRYDHGLEPSQIAARLGAKPATVRTQLVRAHARLRSRLDRDRPREAWAALLLPEGRPSVASRPHALRPALLGVVALVGLTVGIGHDPVRSEPSANDAGDGFGARASVAGVVRGAARRVRLASASASAPAFGVPRGVPRGPRARVGVPAAAGGVGDETPAVPLPLELAFGRAQLRDVDRPAVSADGRWLAYEVFTPPSEPSAREPRPGEGVRLFVVPTQGGEATPVGPADADCWRPSWSPDGRQLAFFCFADGAPRLWVHDLAAQTSRQVGAWPIKARLWPMDAPAWRPDGREVFVPLDPSPSRDAPSLARPDSPAASASTASTVVSASSASVTVYTTDAPDAQAGDPGADLAELQEFLIVQNLATLAGVDVAGGDVRVLVPSDATPPPSLLRVSPDGHWISYSSVFALDPAAFPRTTYDLVLVPIDGGPAQVAARRLDTTERIYRGEPYVWAPDGRRIVFTRAGALWEVEVDADGPRSPRRIEAAPPRLADAPFALTADGRAIVVGALPDGLPSYDGAASGDTVLVPFDGGPARTLPAGWPLTDGSATLWQPDPTAIHLMTLDARTAERTIQRFDLETGEARVVWQGRARIVPAGAGRDGTLVARIEDTLTPPDEFTFDGAFVERRRITRIEPGLADVSVGETHTFETEVPGFDGGEIEVRSTVFLPPGEQPGRRLPTVVYVYSGARLSDLAQDYGGGAPNTIPVQVFASRGYAVLLVDVPLGPLGRAGDPVREMTAAILPQVRHAAELGFTDLERVALLGHSYGAYSAAAVVTQTDLFAAAIAIDGMYDLAGDYGVMGRGGVAYSAQYFEAGQARMGTHPWADRERYLENSPYYLADRIRTPLLLLHGEDDETCPVQEAEKMFNALKRLGRPAELALYAGEGHAPSEWRRADAVDAAQRMLAFLERHLAPPERAEK
ncbi:MAG: sigma-70 family RNA polymerase sigma factor [Planctomycetes bacterium]|nr:sigma-70 family RNA polymerase sigma factor [Planctomycetota bacterium]